MPQEVPAAPSLAAPPGSPRPTQVPSKEISARDIRDLALAVIEGAVAAEALAKELRRSPDRSKHFSEIAERLRAVVNRPSIRNALADDAAQGNATITVRTQQPTPPQPTPMITAPPPPPPQPPAPPPMPIPTSTPSEEARVSGERALPGPSLDEIVRATHADEIARRADEIATRVARIEHALSASVDRIEHVVAGSIDRAIALSGGERTVVGSASDAIALAARLTERVERRGPVVIKIEAK